MNPRLLLLPGVAVVAAAILWRSQGDTQQVGVPACTWRIGVGTEVQQGQPFHELAPESQVRLSCWCEEPRHYYVFSHSAEDGTLLLWPSPLLLSDLPQPLPAGTNVLPGRHKDKDLAWSTRTGIRAVTTYVVIAARERIDEIEELLPRLRQWSNTVFTDNSMHVTKPSTTVDLLGAPGSPGFPTPLLQRAAAAVKDRTLVNGPLHPDDVLPGVWASCWTVVERKP